eukprot:g2758.t1
MCVTLTLYYFRTPDDLKIDRTAATATSTAGPLGPPNAEFDWCELNFPAGARLVAEPVNTLTSLLYVAVAVLQAGPGGPAELHACLLCVAAIGIGSALFHATLRYTLQLADELPMLALVLTAACWLVRPRWGKQCPRLALGALFAGLCAALLSTEREGPTAATHNACRGVLSTAFSACFVVIFWRGAANARSDAQLLRAAAGGGAGAGASFDARSPSPNTLFARSFLIWVAAVALWICDILCCHWLHSLPFGVPFPHLHAWWHVATALGLHYTITLMLWHDQLEAESSGSGGGDGAHTRVFVRFGVLLSLQRRRVDGKKKTT